MARISICIKIVFVEIYRTSSARSLSLSSSLFLSLSHSLPSFIFLPPYPPLSLSLFLSNRQQHLWTRIGATQKKSSAADWLSRSAPPTPSLPFALLYQSPSRKDASPAALATVTAFFPQRRVLAYARTLSKLLHLLCFNKELCSI